MSDDVTRSFAAYPLRSERIWTGRHLLAGLAFLVPLLAAYAVTLPGGVGWWDSGELIAAAKSLSVAHRPGFPLYVVCGRALFGFLDDPCLAANALSALCGVLALLCLWRALVMLFGHTWWSVAWITIGGWLVGFAPLVWRQSLRAEVYTPVYFALAAAFLLAIAAQRAPDPRTATRRFLGAAYVAGLAFCVHTALAVAAWPAFLLLFLWGDFRPSMKQWAVAAAALTVGVSVYLFVPLRAPHAPWVWGDPSTWSGFWAYLTASDSYGIIADQSHGTISRAAELVNLVFDRTPWLLVAPGIAGVAAGALFGHRFGRAPLVLFVTGTLVAATVVSDVIADNFDTQAYLFPLLWALWWGFARLDPHSLIVRQERSSRWRLASVGVIFLLAVSITARSALVGAAAVEPFRLELANRWGEEILGEATDGSLIILQDANTDFLLRGILVSMSDVPRAVVLNVSLAPAPWYRNWWSRRHGDGRLTVPVDHPRWTRAVATWWRAEMGDVYVDYGTPGWLPLELVPAGWLAHWIDSSSAGGTARTIPRMDVTLATDDPDWVRAAVWYYYRLGAFYQARGMHKAASEAWDEGLQWAPAEPELLAARASLRIAAGPRATGAGLDEEAR